MKELQYKIILALFITMLTLPQKAYAEIVSGLSKDTVSVRVLGVALNNTNALNLKISFSNPDAVKLSASSPQFHATGATQLLSASDPESGIVTVVWNGTIPIDEAEISFMLESGASMGISTFSVDKVELAYGIDVTDSVAVVIDEPTIVNSSGTETTLLGKFTLLDPGELYAPGIAAIAFEAENTPSNLTAKLNGSPVTFLENDKGLALVSLPTNASELNLTLEANLGKQQKFVNLGKIKLAMATTALYPPIIDRAYIYNQPDGSQLKVYGRHFGIGRFGRERVNVEVIPGNSPVSNTNLRRRSTTDSLESTDCITDGSYVNIAHPAGTITKKIKVLGECN